MSKQQKMHESVVRDLDSNRLQLPTLPAVALKIRDELQKSDCNVRTVSDVITTDTAMSAKLLQVVNSPLYRSSNAIDNIKTAVTRLGFTQVKNLVTSLALNQMFHSTNYILNQLLQENWNHSARVAAIAAVLSNKVKSTTKDQAVLAGLVHDIGKLPLIVHAEKIPDLVSDSGSLRNLIETLHNDVGGHVLRSWNFTPELVDVATYHENTDFVHDGNTGYLDLIIVANCLSYHGTKHPMAGKDFSDSPSFKRLGIPGDASFIEDEDNATAIAEVESVLTF